MGAVIQADPAPPVEHSPCTGKALFADGSFARKVAGRMSKSKSGSFHAFRCASCRGWHVGRQLRKAKAMRVARTQ